MKSWMKQAALAMVSLPKFASNGRMRFECWNPHHSHANRYRYKAAGGMLKQILPIAKMGALGPIGGESMAPDFSR